MAHPITEILAGFRKVEKHIFFLIGAVFFVQLVDAAFFMLFNYYLRELQYNDTQIATITAYRYLAVMALAFPLGIYIKGRRLKPLFKVAAIALPISTIAVLYAVEHHIEWVVLLGMLIYGSSRLLLQVTAMPFIIINAKTETHSEAISLYFQTFSVSVFMSGLLNFFLNSYWPEFFTEKTVLYLVAILSFMSFYFVLRIDKEEALSEKVPLHAIWHAYDWRLIINALAPTLLLAMGAGFTIPFINLFFQSVHGVESRAFSLIGSFSFVLVAIMLMFVPYIQRRFGFKMVIITFQGLAILALFLMASTEWYKDWAFAFPIAVSAYLLRQPLMNIASPSTSELSLQYVGERNQEILSALQAAIWSGSWFFSSAIFAWMRNAEISYVNIFMITVLLYIVATLWYVRLVRMHEDKKSVTASSF